MIKECLTCGKEIDVALNPNYAGSGGSQWLLRNMDGTAHTHVATRNKSSGYFNYTPPGDPIFGGSTADMACYTNELIMDNCEYAMNNYGNDGCGDDDYC